MIKKALVNPPKKYRPVPFWSWNEKLDPAETALQVREMEKAGMGGYFMHARGGLQTEYLSDEWFDNVNAALNEGKTLGMNSWGYDENGWPSGFGDGKVNGKGDKYRQKSIYAEICDAVKSTPQTLLNTDVDGKNVHIYYKINPFYVDTLNGEVTNEFLRSTHERYKDTLGKNFGEMRGFFTDEPQVTRDGLPWSFIFDSEYKKAYGKSIIPDLAALFFDVENATEIRYNYWKLVRDLFAENFLGKIKKWCEQNGSEITGHLVREETFYYQIQSNGACMPQYEYEDIPGMDHLGRTLPSIQTEMQVASAANQLGKKQILSETFALSGWNVSFEDLRRIYEHQMVHGVNLLCQHLEGYSIRGIRKRDYPASLYKQQPWWEEYRTFNDRVSRIGMLISEGEINCKVLVLHTIESGWVDTVGESKSLSNRHYGKFMQLLHTLENSQIQYHLGDSRIISRYGSVKNGTFSIGTQNYSAVIVPASNCMDNTVFKFLQEFKSQGGTVIFCEEIPSMINGVLTDTVRKFANGCTVTDTRSAVSFIPEAARPVKLWFNDNNKAKKLVALTRRFNGEKFTMAYICNSYPFEHDISVLVKGANSASVYDATADTETAACFEQSEDGVLINVHVEPYGSVILFAYDDKIFDSAIPNPDLAVSIFDKLIGEWKVAYSDGNTLTLDYADLYFDGKKHSENIPVSDIQELACAFEREVKTDIVYHVNVVDKSFTKCELITETPEIYDIWVNGTKIDNTPHGFIHDKSFKRIDIYSVLTVGNNEIKLTCNFKQDEKTYENIKKSLMFESEKNKLSYGMEIEAIYLKGDFGVYTEDNFEALGKRAFRTKGNFYLSGMRTAVQNGPLCNQGYPFFAGKMTLKKTVNLTKDECKAAKVTFSKLCATVTKITVNGNVVKKIMWHPYEADISELLKEGENEIEITLIGSLRNMLGPFHLKQGESYSVGPRSFFKNSPIWNKGENPNYTEGYSFVEYGLFF